MKSINQIKTRSTTVILNWLLQDIKYKEGKFLVTVRAVMPTPSRVFWGWAPPMPVRYWRDNLFASNIYLPCKLWVKSGLLKQVSIGMWDFWEPPGSKVCWHAWLYLSSIHRKTQHIINIIKVSMGLKGPSLDSLDRRKTKTVEHSRVWIWFPVSSVATKTSGH